MLTERAIERARIEPGKRLRKLTDGNGLYLLLTMTGARYWRWDYGFGGKRRTMSFGPWPEVRLAEARQRREDGRKMLRDGLDPCAARKAARVADQQPAGVTFGTVLDDWRDTRAELAPQTRGKLDGLITRYLRPTFGATPIAALTAPTILAALKPIDKSGRHETAHTLKRIIGQVLRYGIAHGAAERDWTQDLRDALDLRKTRSHAGITDPIQLGALLRKIHGETATYPPLAYALKLLPYLFVRPGELRGMAWREIDTADALWRIPADRTKLRRPHLVPLATQVLELLEELKALTGGAGFVFPSSWTPQEPIGPTSMNQVLRRLGYPSAIQTPHGFRTTASTRLHELGFEAAHIEMQMAHLIPGVAGVYNQAKYLKQRRAMMQSWADYLDKLRGKPSSVR